MLMSPTGQIVNNALTDIFGNMSAQPTNIATSRAADSRNNPNPFLKQFSEQLSLDTKNDVVPQSVTSPRKKKKKKKKRGHARGHTTTKLDDRDLQREVLGKVFNPFEQPPTFKAPIAIAQPKPPAPPAEGKTINAASKELKKGDKVVTETSDSKITAERIDALEIMHVGTQFLKYGNFGFPHFRHFHLTTDNSALQWYSKKKHPSKTCVLFKNIKDIIIGQNMPKFRRHRAPELARSSFSIIYGDGKTLDLIAIQPREFKIWITGLKELLKLTKSMGADSLGSVNHLYMTVKTTAKLPENDLREKLGSPMSAHGDAFPEMRKDAGHGDKRLFKEVDAELEKLKKRVSSLETKLDLDKYRKSKQYRTMQAIARKVKDQIRPLKDLMLDGEFKECDDKIWRAGVALESLEHMMAACS